MSATNDQIFAELMKLNKTVGGIEQAVKETHSFTAAVNIKAEDLGRALNEHINTNGAHGASFAEKAAGGTRDNFIAWAGLGTATFAAMLPLAIEWINRRMGRH